VWIRLGISLYCGSEDAFAEKKSYSAFKSRPEAVGNPDRLLAPIIKEDDPGFGSRHLLTGLLIAEPVKKIAGFGGNVPNRYLDPDHLPEKGLRFVDDGGIGGNIATTVYVQVGIAQVLQKQEAGLFSQRENGVMSQVIPGVDVAEAEAQIG